MGSLRTFVAKCTAFLRWHLWWGEAEWKQYYQFGKVKKPSW